MRNKKEEERCNQTQHWFNRFSTIDGKLIDKKGNEGPKKFGIRCERCLLVAMTSQPLFLEVSY